MYAVAAPNKDRRVCSLWCHPNWQVEAGIESLLANATLLHYQDQELMGTNAVWFMCCGTVPGSGEISNFLVFRGTMSPSDAIADVMFRPESSPNNSVSCHGGFLRTVREDATLHCKLNELVAGTNTPLYIMGHSLGGALSQTIVGAGFLPPTFSGQLTVVSLGGPAAFCQPIPAGALVGPAASARVISIVHGNDVVPRLLGSKLAFTRKVLLGVMASTSAKKRRANELLLNTFESYTSLPQTELVFVCHDGTAQQVADHQKELVLHLAEALHPRAIADHLGYVAALEAASHTGHWTPPKAELKAA